MRTPCRFRFPRLVILASVPLLALGAKESLAQQEEFEYAAKIVCGLQKDPKDMRLTRGYYATTINVHNPSTEPTKVFKKLALTYPPGRQKPGRVQRFEPDALGPDEALETDCMDIRDRMPNGTFPTPYIEGFVIVQSRTSLDVTAVYSTASLVPGAAGVAHSSIDVEQIRERQRRGGGDAPDLIPVPHPRFGFCWRDGNKLFVTVKNQGSGPAGPSTTEVNFGAYGIQSQPTPALAPGASTLLSFTIPTSPNCFDPDCEFRIRVDSTNVVTESDETNNTASGTCVG